MKINFQDIPELGLELLFSGNEAALADAVSKLPKPEEAPAEPNIGGRLLLTKNGDDVIMSGVITGFLRLQCSRCLRDFRLEKELEMDFTIRRSKPEDHLEKQYKEKDDDVVLIRTQEFDPGEIILQELLLEIPMKPLCAEACPGLCPKCGALKDSSECKCPPGVSIDPRWEALAKLKDKVND